MAKKQKKLIVVTPAGTAAYAWLSKPDEGQQYSDGKYKVTLVLDADTDLSDLEAKCRQLAEEAFPGVDESDIRMPFVDGDTKGKEEFEGKILITMKTKFAPKQVDSKKRPLPESVSVFSGDLIKVAAAIVPYESTEKVTETVKGKKVSKTVKVYGITLALNAVQLLEKRNGGGDGASYFDEEDGFTADEDESGSNEGSDEDTDDGDGNF
jgi:hypothetical protein